MPSGARHVELPKVFTVTVVGMPAWRGPGRLIAEADEVGTWISPRERDVCAGAFGSAHAASRKKTEMRFREGIGTGSSLRESAWDAP
jgi:hypothetical protein